MPQENLFTLICTEVATSKLSEVYLFAGMTLEIPGVSPSLLQAVQEALQASDNNPVITVAKAFNTAPGTSGPRLADNMRGMINTPGGAVEFYVRKVGADPEAFSVLFTRVDDRVTEWNAVHPVGSRFLCEAYPDAVLTSVAPAFFVKNLGVAVECRIPGLSVGTGGGVLVDDLVCVAGLKSASARVFN